MPRRPMRKIPKRPLKMEEKIFAKGTRDLIVLIKDNVNRGNLEEAKKIFRRKLIPAIEKNISSLVSEHFLRKMALDESLPYELRREAYKLFERSVFCQEKLANVKDPIKRATLIVSEPISPEIIKNLKVTYEKFLEKIFREALSSFPLAELFSEELEEEMKKMKGEISSQIEKLTSTELERGYKLMLLSSLEEKVKRDKSISEREKNLIIRHISRLKLYLLKRTAANDLLAFQSLF